MGWRLDLFGSGTLAAVAIVVGCTGQDPDIADVPVDGGSSGADGPSGDPDGTVDPDGGGEAPCIGCEVAVGGLTSAVDGFRIAGGFIYYSLADNTIWRVDVSAAQAPAMVVQHADGIGRFAVDDTNIYFAGKKPSNNKNGIFFVAVAGGTAAEILATQASGGHDIVADVEVANGRVYWSSGPNGRVFGAAIGDPTAATLAEVSGATSGISLAPPTEITFGYERQGATGFGRCEQGSCDGGVQSFLVVPSLPKEIRRSSGLFFWHDTNEAFIRRAGVDAGNLFDGGATSDIAVSLASQTPGARHCSGFDVDDEHIYYAPNPTRVVRRVKRDGTGDEVHAAVGSQPADVVLDGNFVYWRDATGIRRKAK
jgi:hypothetical protein